MLRKPSKRLRSERSIWSMEGNAVATAPHTQSELLNGLSNQEVAAISSLWSQIDILEAMTIFSEGAPASRLYLVVEEQVALQKAIRTPHAAWPRHTTVAVCQPGELIGWSALIPPYRYTLSALAWSHCKLLQIHSTALRDTLNAQPDLGFKVMLSVSAVVSKRLSQTVDALINAREMPMWQQ